MENVIERMERLGAKEKAAYFRVKQKQDYDFKVRYAEERVREFVSECGARGLNYHVSVGGLDSITLLLFLRKLGIGAPAISASGLEDRSIQAIHRDLGVENVKPLLRNDGSPWNRQKVLQDFGFPVLSKEKAAKIETLQNPTEKNKTIRHAIMTGETGAYGGNRTGTKMRLPQKWLNLFGGPMNEEEGTNYQCAPFCVSSKCCYYLKEKPCDNWAKKHNSVPFLGLMASEGGRREKSLALNGCNYFGTTTIRSAPFAIFGRQDILRLAQELETPVPDIYGAIVEDPDGTLRTTRAQRTGCSMCGFGIHIEKRPHRFDRLREDNPKEWEFWMYRCVTDQATGEKYGWGRVLDYIGIKWEDEYKESDTDAT